jgi:hypothetical protein
VAERATDGVVGVAKRAADGVVGMAESSWPSRRLSE